MVPFYMLVLVKNTYFYSKCVDLVLIRTSYLGALLTDCLGVN